MIRKRPSHRGKRRTTHDARETPAPMAEGDPRIRSLSERIDVIGDEETNRSYPDLYRSIITVEMRDGTKHVRDITGILKSANVPVDREYIADWAKKLDLFSSNPNSIASVAKLQLSETVFFCTTARDPNTGSNVGTAVTCWGPAGNPAAAPTCARRSTGTRPGCTARNAGAHR